MSSFLDSHVLEIQPDRTPDFAAARSRLAAMTDDELEAIDYLDGYEADEARETLAEAIDAVETGWNEESDDIARADLRAGSVLFASGPNYGDAPDGVEALRVLDLSGLAEAAGFEAYAG